MAFTMSLIDTLIAPLLKQITPTQITLFELMYGEGHSIILQWVILALIYFTTLLSTYLCTLIQHRIGKKTFFLGIIAIGLLLFIIVPLLIRYVPATSISDMISALSWIMGYGIDGTIHFIYPILLLGVCLSVIGAVSYTAIRQMELR